MLSAPSVSITIATHLLCALRFANVPSHFPSFPPDSSSVTCSDRVLILQYLIGGIKLCSYKEGAYSMCMYQLMPKTVWSFFTLYFPSAVSDLLRNLYFDDFHCINSSLCDSSLNFAILFISLLLHFLLFHHPFSRGYISPIHRGVRVCCYFVCSSFVTLAVQKEHPLFSSEVLISHVSQFSYFYNRACPRESCSFTLRSYIFYLFSGFPSNFLPQFFLFDLILPLLSSSSAYALFPIQSSSH